MRLFCRLFDCAFYLLVLDGGAVRMRCTRCGHQSEGWQIR